LDRNYRNVISGQRCCNIALDRPTTASSLLWHGAYPSSLAVDGNNDPDLAGGLSCFSSSIEYSPWWSVTLDKVSLVTTVAITNRIDVRKLSFNAKHHTIINGMF